MQKQVSKRGLAVLALSILLVLSLGLTATFAAFSTTASTTGMVTFVDSIELKQTNSSGGSIAGKTINVHIDVGTAAVTVDNDATKLGSVYINAGGATYYWKATLAITSGSDLFTFETSGQPNMGSTATATTTAITWGGSDTSATTLNVDAMLAGLQVEPDYAAIGAAASPSGQLTLTIQVSYAAIA